MNDAPHTRTLRRSLGTAEAILLATAFLLVAIVLVQAGRLPGNAAYAEMGVAGDDFTLVTASSGRGDDADPYEILWIVDSRGEVLHVYEIEDVRQGGIQQRATLDLRNVFANARR